MIPKIIHQVYWDFSGKNNAPPKEWLEYSKTIQKHNSNWEYKLWDYDSCINLLKKHYPWFLKPYNEYKHPIQRADAIRPFILYHYGGIYFDMDYICVKNITNFFKKYGIYILESAHFGLTNSLMASSKNHPFWKIVFTEMVKQKKKKFYQTHHLYIMQSTGPSLITNCYNIYKKEHIKNNDIYLIPKELFNPCNVCEKNCKITKKIYCYTINASSWHKLDSKIMNFFFCHYNKIILCIIIAIITIINRKKIRRFLKILKK